MTEQLKAKVLLVDDEEDFLSTLAERLGDQGLEGDHRRQRRSWLWPRLKRKGLISSFSIWPCRAWTVLRP